MMMSDGELQRTLKQLTTIAPPHLDMSILVVREGGLQSGLQSSLRAINYILPFTQDDIAAP